MGHLWDQYLPWHMLFLLPSKVPLIFPPLFSGLTCLPEGARGKESGGQRRRHKRHKFNPWVGKIP